MNRVYADEVVTLTAAKPEVAVPFVSGITQAEVAGIGCLTFDVKRMSRDKLAGIVWQPSAFVLSQHDGDLLRPATLPRTGVLDDNLVTIPEYQEKVNKQFTRPLLSVTVVAARRSTPHWAPGPMARRDTTISTVLIVGCDAFGVEANDKASDAMVAFYKTWLCRRRIKHTATVIPMRRNGARIDYRFSTYIAVDRRGLVATVLTGDAHSSGPLHGKRRFGAIITDTPYSAVHGSTSGGRRSRTPAQLLTEAVPVWAGQLHLGGPLGISWNTLDMPREDLVALLVDASLEVLTGRTWDRFMYHVDSSIRRNLMVTVRPVATG